MPAVVKTVMNLSGSIKWLQFLEYLRSYLAYQEDSCCMEIISFFVT